MNNNIEELFAQYRELLSQHDWYYQYSDDHRVWKNGDTVEKEITKISKELVELGQKDKELEIYNEYAPASQRRTA